MLLGVFCASAAFAQTSTQAEQKAATTAPKATEKASSTESVECSKQADAKKLHGKERQTFRAACKKEHMAKKT
jgi:hypothetical protein